MKKSSGNFSIGIKRTLGKQQLILMSFRMD